MRRSFVVAVNAELQCTAETAASQTLRSTGPSPPHKSTTSTGDTEVRIACTSIHELLAAVSVSLSLSLSLSLSHTHTHTHTHTHNHSQQDATMSESCPSVATWVCGVGAVSEAACALVMQVLAQPSGALSLST